MKKLKRLLLICIVIGSLLALWAFYIEPSRLIVTHKEIALKDWPSELDGYRILLITDIHAGSPYIGEAKLNKMVEMANAQNPDIVLLGGDYVIQGVLGGTFMTPEAIAEFLSQLQSSDGSYAVLGNHDWWDDAKHITTVFEKAGISMLEDASVPVSHNRERFWLVGVSDYYEAEHDIAKATARIDTNEPVIVLTHTPDIFPELPDYVNLGLAGHTHAGQVRLPFIGAVIANSKYGQRYAYGEVREGNSTFFTSAGIGTSVLPVRFLATPEIVVLDLYSQ